MTWTTIGEIVLLGWLAIAMGIFVVVFVRRFRADGGAAGTHFLGSLRLIGGLGGPEAPTPRPEWVDWEESKSSDDD